MKSFVICVHLQILLGTSNKEEWVDGTCGTHGRGDESVYGFGEKALRRETTWETKA
jgi:hypothetical protein